MPGLRRGSALLTSRTRLAPRDLGKSECQQAPHMIVRKTQRHSQKVGKALEGTLTAGEFQQHVSLGRVREHLCGLPILHTKYISHLARPHKSANRVESSSAYHGFYFKIPYTYWS